MASTEVVLRGKQDWNLFCGWLRILSAQYWKYWDPTVAECDRPAPPRDPGELDDYLEKFNTRSSNAGNGASHGPGTLVRDLKNSPGDGDGDGDGPDVFVGMTREDALAMYKILDRKHEKYMEANFRVQSWIFQHVTPAINAWLDDLPADCRARVPFLYKYYKTEVEWQAREADIAYNDALNKFDMDNMENWLQEWTEAVCNAGRFNNSAAFRDRWLHDLASLLDGPIPQLAWFAYGMAVKEEDNDPMDAVEWAARIRRHLLSHRDDEAAKRSHASQNVVRAGTGNDEARSTAGSTPANPPRQGVKRGRSATAYSRQQPAWKRGRDWK